MAESEQNPQRNLDPEQYTGLVRAALEPDERKFFKAFLGQESPDIGDYLSPQGRFANARQLREHITRSVLSEAIKQSQAPTQEEANTAFPGFPIAPSSRQIVPQSPLESPEMPVLRGTQTLQVPDNKFQGPMPGVITPLGQQTVDLMNARQPGEPSLLSSRETERFMERGPAFYQESPRPLRTVTVGEYGPDQAPAQSEVVNMQAKLPPSFQALYNAKVHQEGLKGGATPRATSDADIKLANQLRLEAIIQSGQERYPGERELLENQLGLYSKGVRPGTPEAKKLNAEVIQEEAKASVAGEKVIADLAHVKAGTKYTEAQTNEIQTLLNAKLAKLLADADAARAMGSKESIGAYYKEQQALLGQAKAFIDMAQEGRKGKTLSDESYAKLMDLGLESLSAGVKAEATNRSWLEKTFGSKKPVDLGPRPEGEAPRRLTPWMNPSGIAGQAQTPAPLPEPPVEPPQDDTTALRSLGMSMKEGETKLYKGQKYRRKGGKLEKVQ